MSSLEAIASFAPSSASKASESRNNFAADFDNFLLILTTQLQNQDPLSPTDTHEFTNQLVMFADVEQSIQQNANLEKMISMQASNQAIGALSYLGKEVEAEGNMFNYDGEDPVTLSYDLKDTAETAALTISDINGDPVLVTKIDGTFGKQQFVWDGKTVNGNALAPGVYSFQVNAVNANDQPVDVTTSIFAEVDGVETDDTGTFLTVGNLSLPVDKVFAVRQPTSTQTGI